MTLAVPVAWVLLETWAPSEARLKLKNIAAKTSEDERRTTGRMLCQLQTVVTYPINAANRTSSTVAAVFRARLLLNRNRKNTESQSDCGEDDKYHGSPPFP
jgi:hypothetical protein